MYLRTLAGLNLLISDDLVLVVTRQLTSFRTLCKVLLRTSHKNLLGGFFINLYRIGLMSNMAYMDNIALLWEEVFT